MVVHRRNKQPVPTPSVATRSERKSDGADRRRLGLLYYVSVSVVLLCNFWYLVGSFGSDGAPFGGYTLMGSVPRVRLPGPDTPFREDTIKHGVPVILTNTVVQNWDALNKWDISYVEAQAGNTIKNVYVHKEPLFGPLWRDKKPFAAMKTLVHRNQFGVQDMPKKAFFSRMANTSAQTEYVYYTGSFESRQLAKDLQPFKELLVPGKVEHVNIWAGQAGVVTHLHYDSYENFFVQLSGRKKFLIFPPSQTHNVYSYPFLHPSNAQSQINLDQPDLDAFPHHANAACWEADLGPGDMLYIPPMYWHQVVAIDSNFGMNAWSKSVFTEYFNEAIQASVKPFIRKNEVSKWIWTAHSKSATVYYLLRRLFSKVEVSLQPPAPPAKTPTTFALFLAKLGLNKPSPGLTADDLSQQPSSEIASPRKYMNVLWAERYEQLVANGELVVQQSSPSSSHFLCPATGAKEGDVLSSLSNGAGEKAEVEAIVTDMLPKLVSLFNKFPASIRFQFLGNYIESLALWAVGGESAVDFFYHCYVKNQ
mmetsp:Transcript_49212/g.96502  ORF Transcript_49212/g.96502 Transcript_49212/m.96502 type:complete len:534 (+) Transcript_49212:3-1604(+)